jgi:CheY-like chemotaxis protein
MKRVLLLLDHKTNRALLSDWLKQHYEVVIPDNGTSLVVPFDLCLIDGPTLDRLWQEVRLRKAEEAPTFLPVVLITSQREAELLTRHLWKTVDELIRVPIEKLELQARVEILLRTRQLSQELKLRNEDLESFFYAMTHDVRAPLRATVATRRSRPAGPAMCAPPGAGGRAAPGPGGRQWGATNGAGERRVAHASADQSVVQCAQIRAARSATHGDDQGNNHQAGVPPRDQG